MQKTYHGSCHCGAVQFDVDLDLETADTVRCNCSICRRQRYWMSLVEAEFVRVTTGMDALTDYQFGSNTVHHLFCRTCGVKTFGRAHFDIVFEGRELRGEFYAINLPLLDAADEELAGAKIRFEDGRNDDYTSAPAVTSYL